MNETQHCQYVFTKYDIEPDQEYVFHNGRRINLHDTHTPLYQVVSMADCTVHSEEATLAGYLRPREEQ